MGLTCLRKPREDLRLAHAPFHLRRAMGARRFLSGREGRFLCYSGAFGGSRGPRSSGEKHDMAKHCEICGKTPVVGRIVSHAHNVRPRRFEPNLQRVRALVNGGIRRLRVCTRCIRSNKVVKAA